MRSRKRFRYNSAPQRNNLAVLAEPQPGVLEFLGRPVLLLAAVACVLTLFVLLRELGYALAAHFWGGSILDFPANLFILGQRATLAGQFTPLERGLLATTRLALPLLSWVAFITVAPRRASLPLELAKLVSTVLAFLWLVPWIAAPLLALTGRAPGQWDAVRFMANTAVPPVRTEAAVLLLLLGMITLVEARLANPASTFAVFLDGSPAAPVADGPGIRPQNTFLLTCVAFTVAALVVAGSIDTLAHTQRGILPAGYRRVTDLDLSAAAHDNEVFYTFRVDQPQSIALMVVVKDTDLAYLHVQLLGPGSDSWGVIHADESRTAYDHIAWRDLLQPGEYRLRVDSPKGLGTLTVYAKGLAR